MKKLSYINKFIIQMQLIMNKKTFINYFNLLIYLNMLKIAINCSFKT